MGAVMTERTYLGSYGDRHPISGAHLSDEAVATQVRMLMRDQLNHEAVCQTARDRIMCLTEEKAALADACEYALSYMCDGGDPRIDQHGDELCPFELIRSALAASKGGAA